MKAPAMKKQTIQGVPNRWTCAARGTALNKQIILGTPRGKCEPLFVMGESWLKIPKALLEDAAGNLWLAFVEKGEIDKEGGFEPADVVQALTWLQHVSEYCDGWDGDIADVCRIALGELARRPSDLERVRRAVMEETQAGCKPRRARKVKRP